MPVVGQAEGEMLREALWWIFGQLVSKTSNPCFIRSSNGSRSLVWQHRYSANVAPTPAAKSRKSDRGYRLKIGRQLQIGCGGDRDS